VIAAFLHDAWLFLKGAESVRVVRAHQPARLLVLGPGHHRERYGATEEHDLNALQARIEARLRRDGWSYEGAGVERRTSSDRRTARRWLERRLQDG
jgi:hypothetical protein